MLAHRYGFLKTIIYTIHPFNVCTPVAFSVFIQMCNHHCCGVPDTSVTADSLYIKQQILPYPLPSPWQLLLHFLNLVIFSGCTMWPFVTGFFHLTFKKKFILLKYT